MNDTATLFSPFTLRSVTLPNRVGVSPMCQYSSEDGFATDWHLVHLGTRAVGGAGLVFTEATAVTPEGRISPQDLGLWKDEHIPQLKRIVEFVHSQGSYAGIQLAHAGRKASTARPWDGDGLVKPEDGGWTDVVAPSAIPFSSDYALPRELDAAGIKKLIGAFVDATSRAKRAGFDVIEIHAAHGYLLHEFLSPLSNHRTDNYGGSFENRIRLLIEVTDAIRSEWGEQSPIAVRISATDWAEGGWDVDQSVELSKVLKQHGVDLMDVSSGALVPHVRIPVGPGYQTPFAERIRKEAGIPTATVGMITDPAQADHVVRTGQADMVLLAREFLRQPYWALEAARDLQRPASWPVQYLRAAPSGAQARHEIAAPKRSEATASK
jgi:2,4-dienoyl-CoA reductase-like NADH-dependent reductase (Old Yellow Enzyme family)